MGMSIQSSLVSFPVERKVVPRSLDKTKEDFDYDYADLRGPMKVQFHFSEKQHTATVQTPS